MANENQNLDKALKILDALQLGPKAVGDTISALIIANNPALAPAQNLIATEIVKVLSLANAQVSAAPSTGVFGWLRKLLPF